MRQFTRTIAFLLIGAVIFFSVQDVFTPNNTEGVGCIWGGFLALEENSVDVLLLGTSNMYNGLSPMRIYEDTGIRAYSLATPMQPIDMSYALLKAALRTQKPKVVVLDAGSLFLNEAAGQEKEAVTNAQEPAKDVETVQLNYAVSNDSESRNNAWKWLLTAMPWGRDKFTVLKEYLKMTYSDGLLPSVFPFINTHTRWQDLAKADFTPDHMAGYYYTGGMSSEVTVFPSAVSAELVNDVAGWLMERNVGEDTAYDGKKTTTMALTAPVFEPFIDEYNAACLLEIKWLCEENGAELMLVKIPVIFFPTRWGGAWPKAKAKLTRKLAKEQGLDYVDFLYDYDDLIDFSTDTFDGGGHLNVRGAEKVAVALEPILLAKIPGGGQTLSTARC